MDFSRLNRTRVLVGGAAAILLILSLIFLPWFELETNPQRAGDPDENPNFNEDAFVCGTGDFECTGFETFPILRWLLIAACFAPLILAWIIVRGHRLSWAPGEMTMVVGFTAFILVFYNGVIDRPGSQTSEIQVGLEIGYWLALLATAMMATTGFLRSQESGGRVRRKAPGTV